MSIATRSIQPSIGGQTEAEDFVPVRIVDSDVHPMLTRPAEMKEYLPQRWHHLLKYQTVTGIRIDAINNGTRVDARPADGRPAGSVPELMKQQLLDEAGVDIAVFTYHTMGNLPDPEADAAWTSAINLWQRTKWLGEYNSHQRFRGSIRVAAHNPDAAIKEIQRWADDARFVQVLLVHPYQPAFGHPMYEPIWQAAAECGLPVAMHVSVGQLGAIQFSHPCGHPSYMFEWHTGSYPAAYAAHAASLVCSGTFERIPKLKFVMVEGGFSWSLPLGQHLDRNWRLLRSEVPHLKRLPSEYLHDHVLFTSQPVEEGYDPESDDSILRTWKQLGAETRLMFSSDYPHWDFDDPKRALPKMPDDLKRRIMAETAIELYKLPRVRPKGD